MGMQRTDEWTLRMTRGLVGRHLSFGLVLFSCCLVFRAKISQTFPFGSWFNGFLCARLLLGRYINFLLLQSTHGNAGTSTLEGVCGFISAGARLFGCC